MKKLNNLKLYEEYINSGSNRVNTLLKNLVQSLNASFSGTNGSLGVKDLEGLSLIDLEQSVTGDAFEKNILMRFSDNSYQYQMIFVIKLEDVKDNDAIDKGYMKLKIYNGDDGTMLREWQKDLTLHESTDDEINSEGRWFLKVGENENASQDSQSQDSQSQSQVQTGDLDFIEHFIIEKLGFLKEFLDKSKNGPQLDVQSSSNQQESQQ